MKLTYVSSVVHTRRLSRTKPPKATSENQVCVSQLSVDSVFMVSHRFDWTGRCQGEGTAFVLHGVTSRVIVVTLRVFVVTSRVFVVTSRVALVTSRVAVSDVKLSSLIS